MDSVKGSSFTPTKSRLARTFAKVLNLRSVTGVAPDSEVNKIKSVTEQKDNQPKDAQVASEDEDEKLRNKAIIEALLAKLFASISAIKAAYAQLQQAQAPYDAEGIQSADDLVVTELKNLAEMRQCFLKKQLDDDSPQTTMMLAEIQEIKNLLKTYEIMEKKLDSQTKLQDSEITFLREKLDEANRENKLLGKKLNSSGSLTPFENLHLSSLTPSHLIAFHKRSEKSILSFVRLLVSEVESAGWDLDAAANSIEPDVVYWNPSRRSFAFESFVCREMFDGSNDPYFSKAKETLPDPSERQQQFFMRFMELRSVKATDYLAWKPKSAFAKFCRAKYSRLVHPKLEESLFGNVDQRNLVSSGEHPQTPFFSTFAEMAKHVWLLHCLAFSFNPEASVFQVSKGSRFSEVFMVSANDKPFIISPKDAADTEPWVAFTVIPGFLFSNTVIPCQVYLR